MQLQAHAITHSLPTLVQVQRTAHRRRMEYQCMSVQGIWGHKGQVEVVQSTLRHGGSRALFEPRP